MDNTIQPVREHIIRQIRVVLSEFLPDVGSGTLRILGVTPNSLLDPEDYVESIRPFVSETEQYLQKYHPDNETRFIAAKIVRGKTSYFILDLNNTDYNYETAHECKTRIPVYVLRPSKRQPTIFRKRELDASIAKILRNMHNLHGQDPLPLFDNHYDENLQYPNPRRPQFEF
ncbi:hypothetical protein BO94DRAFT_61290 [Aspergillus sclerotioniger CBS 115572]|uniref:Uncharacterized protein n=1 Tax=Aspergillus sclerotioniger CBS 115572 TaxID=1450535 RepID=A0A317WNH2_9EURO|nr:hypothetical protein BO94DRAFT_61290 [Aspergillus sclerotioniger CBS 115572]PWY88019.1 hypothetical protein BO94DRAFT_61290 [Aspergillus sclerotioniger CBS 115572]